MEGRYIELMQADTSFRDKVFADVLCMLTYGVTRLDARIALRLGGYGLESSYRLGN